MDNHLRDYNSLITQIPEIGIWQQIISTLDISTLNKFLLAFPVMRLFYDFTSFPRYVGDFIIRNRVYFLSGDGIRADHFMVEKTTLPVYKYCHTKKPGRFLINSLHLFIMRDQLFLVSDDGVINQLSELRHGRLGGRRRDELPIFKFLFIPTILKFRTITDDFLRQIQDRYDDMSESINVDVEDVLGLFSQPDY